MKKLKLVSILVTILFISVLIFYLRSVKITEKLTPPTNVTNEDICNIFSDKETRDLCTSSFETCKENPEPKSCTATDMLMEGASRDAAKKICSLFPTEHLQHYCMANSLARVDLNASLAECDLIEGEHERYHCRGDQKMDVMGFDEGLAECNNAKDEDNLHYCKGALYSTNKNYTELGKKECELIKSESLKRDCNSFYK